MEPAPVDENFKNRNSVCFQVVSTSLSVRFCRKLKQALSLRQSGISSVNHIVLHGLHGSKMCCTNTPTCISKIFGRQPMCLPTKADLPEKKWREIWIRQLHRNHRMTMRRMTRRGLHTKSCGERMSNQLPWKLWQALWKNTPVPQRNQHMLS